MITKEQFLEQAVAVSLSKYPTVAELVKAGDPRVLQQLNAQATMLAMYSQQIEVAYSEIFEKTSDATVLADAAMRGIIPTATAARVLIEVTNASDTEYAISAGDVLLDVKGIRFIVDAPAVIPANGAGMIHATQRYSITQNHTVTESKPFYAIQITGSDDDSYLCGVRVSDNIGEYNHSARYTNVFSGDRVYHIEADESGRIYVRFGHDDIVGVQPSTGTVIRIDVSYSVGVYDVKAGSLMTAEKAGSDNYGSIAFTMRELLTAGSNPPSIATLRELAKYPSTYNENAVFLGDFDFLIRRNFPQIKFLSVWNEGEEERHRGHNLKNINTLFIAMISEYGSEKSLIETSEKISPEVIAENDLTASQRAVMERVKFADDSYRLTFYTPIIKEIKVTIDATVSTSSDAKAIKERIISAILDTYGQSAAGMRVGQALPLYQQAYKILLKAVPELGTGRSDVKIEIDNASGDDSRPELWRFVSEKSLSVTVKQANITIPYWAGGL